MKYFEVQILVSEGTISYYGVFTRMSAKYQSDEGRKEIEDTEHEIAKLGVTLLGILV